MYNLIELLSLMNLFQPNSPIGSMILTGFEAALGLPTPALFSALTLKMYSLFSMTSLIMALSSSALVSWTGDHFTDVLSRSSMM